jgi:hypothetical protein
LCSAQRRGGQRLRQRFDRADVPGEAIRPHALVGHHPERNPLRDELVDFALRLDFKEIPSASLHAAKARVVDSMGCAMAAFLAPPVRALRRVATPIADGHGARLFGTLMRTTPDENVTFGEFIAQTWADGGFMMWPLGAALAIGMIIIIWKLVDLSTKTARTRKVLRGVDERLGERDIEGRLVGGDEEAEIAGGRLGALGGEAHGMWRRRHVEAGIDAGRDPEQRGHAEEHRAIVVKGECETEQQVGRGEYHVARRQQHGKKSGHGREGKHRKRVPADGRHDAEQRDGERNEKRQGKQEGTETDHGRYSR